MKEQQPEPTTQLTFQNYFPKSVDLRLNSNIIPISNESSKVEKETMAKMNELSTLEALSAGGKINIYPKKNTVDLKKQLSKKEPAFLFPIPAYVSGHHRNAYQIYSVP